MGTEKSPLEINGVKSAKVNGWNFYSTDKVIKLNDEHLDNITERVQDYSSILPKEKTWVQENYGVPSLFIRVNAFCNGCVQIDGISTDPVGVGLASTMYNSVADNVANYKEKLPEINFLNLLPGKNDYHLWLKQTKLKKAKKMPAFVRLPNDLAHEARFKSLSITPTVNQNNDYGCQLGLWSDRVGLADCDNLPWNDAFVLRPLFGDINQKYVFHPEHDYEKERGRMGLNSKKEIAEILRLNPEGMYLQKRFVPGFNKVSYNFFTMYSLYFFFNPQKNSYEYRFGVHVSRHNWCVKEARNSIIGLLEPIKDYSREAIVKTKNNASNNYFGNTIKSKDKAYFVGSVVG